MKEFKELIEKLNTSFSDRQSFTKTKNRFNVLHNEFLELQIRSSELYNLIYPLERLFLQLT